MGSQSANPYICIPSLNIIYIYISLSAKLRLWGSWRWHQSRELSMFSSTWLWGQTTTRCSMATFWPSRTNNNNIPHRFQSTQYFCPFGSGSRGFLKLTANLNSLAFRKGSALNQGWKLLALLSYHSVQLNVFDGFLLLRTGLPSTSRASTRTLCGSYTLTSAQNLGESLSMPPKQIYSINPIWPICKPHWSPMFKPFTGFPSIVSPS